MSGEDKFVKRRIYLTLERGRDVALRNLLRKVFIAGGFEEPGEGESTPVRRTRIPLAEFQVAISMGSEGVLHDPDEVECLVANMIYKVSHTSHALVCEFSTSPPPKALTDETLESHERLHRARAWGRGALEEGRLSWDGHLMI